MNKKTNIERIQIRLKEKYSGLVGEMCYKLKMSLEFSKVYPKMYQGTSDYLNAKS